MSGPELTRELEKVLAHAERNLDYCSRGLLRRDEVQQQVLYVDTAILEVIREDSPLYRICDRRRKEHTDYWQVTPSGYATPSDCRNLEYRITTIRLMLDELEPEFLRDDAEPKIQYYFSPGEVFRSKKKILDTLRRAGSDLCVVDPYLDADIFDYIDALDYGVDVRLVTANRKPIFVTLLHALQQTRDNVEARESTTCHDRFVIADNAEVWHLGGSINGAGKKAFMVNRVLDEDELRRFMDDFNIWWSSGTLI